MAACLPSCCSLVVNEVDRATLNAVVRRPRVNSGPDPGPHRVGVGDGTAISRIAHELGVTVNTVKLWRRRYERMGLAVCRSGAARTAGGLWPSRARSGHRLTLEPPPEGITHWSARRLGERVGMSETTVWRIWQTAKLKPHRVETFSSARIRRSKPRSAMSSGSIWLHRSGPSCCRSMRRPRSRL